MVAVGVQTSEQKNVWYAYVVVLRSLDSIPNE